MENRLGAVAPVRQPRTSLKDEDGAKYLKKKDYGQVCMGLGAVAVVVARALSAWAAHTPHMCLHCGMLARQDHCLLRHWNSARGGGPCPTRRTVQPAPCTLTRAVQATSRVKQRAAQGVAAKRWGCFGVCC